MRSAPQLIIVAVIAAAAGGAWWWVGQAPASESSRRDQAPTPVETADASTGTVADTIEAVGTTLADEAVDIVADVEGRVTALNFEEGQVVEAGRILAAIDDVREQAELSQAEAQLADARSQYDRALQLRRSNNVAQSQVDQLQAALAAAEAQVAIAQESVSERLIRAPFAGVVGRREVSPGALVDTGTVITTLDDIDPMDIRFDVPERFLGVLRQGQAVEASTVAFDDASFEGAVDSVGTRIDPATRTVPVQASFPNAEGRLRPGMFMTVGLVLSTRENAVLVPEQALVTEGEEQYVFVVEDGTARRVGVKTGLRQDGAVEIVSGLEAGQPVVVSGLQAVRDGGAVEVQAGEDAAGEGGETQAGGAPAAPPAAAPTG